MPALAIHRSDVTGLGRIAYILRSALLVALGLPMAAQAAPSASEIVENSVKALRSTSYQAKMRFISYDAGVQTQREVQIYHVAPDLYHVVPISGGTEKSGSYYIENAQELVLIRNGATVGMPERQFAINDAFTVKFLRDLTKNAGTTVLNGQVGSTEVFALRQDLTASKPYTITVGVDKKSWFPLYLMVNDGEGRTRVYYEMLSIDYKRPDELDDSLFMVPEPSEQARKDAPRSPKRATAMAAPAAGGGAASESSQQLPLYPNYLPRNYVLEAIRLIDSPIPTAGPANGKVKPDLVFQLEAYGPGPGDLISIFQSRGNCSALGLDKLKPKADSGFVVGQQGDWVVTVFGSTVSNKELNQILKHLGSKDDIILKLLQETGRLDALLDEAFPDSN